jgi:hypothetical protein
MQKITKVQIITIFLIFAYFMWELVVWFWARSEDINGAIIRVDLLIIYPILLIFIIISIYQFFKK